MSDTSCPQCQKPPSGASSRLVRDSCGHQKCRMCLLSDENECKQCKDAETPEVKVEEVVIMMPSVIKREITHPESSTSVITCNGTPLKSNRIETVQKTVVNKRKSGAKKKTKSSDSSTSSSKKKSKHRTTFLIPDHIKVQQDPPMYTCDICSKQFVTRSHVKYHLYCTGGPKPFKCDKCLKDFVTKSQLEVHLLKHDGKKPHTCHICEKSFAEKSKLKRHNLLHTSIKPYVCSECGKAFRGKESLKLHLLIHRGEKPYSCKFKGCKLSFSNVSNLNKHLISHSSEKAHMCDQCGKRFKLKWALTVHRRSHLQVRPFECNTCSRAFVNNKDLQRHQLIHLETKAYLCSICRTNFRRKDNLHRHVKNTHPGKKTEPILETVKQLLIVNGNSSSSSGNKVRTVVDNPNAINVITTVSPSSKIKTDSQPPLTVAPKKPDTRPSTVINGPLKLAFKTSAFKNNYNIHRTCDYDITKPYDLAESVNICQKILTPYSPPTSTRGIIKKVTTEPSSSDICKKILSPYTNHYETSFEHKKHAIIKNIKFKLPLNYTNLNAKSDDGSVKNSATSVIVNGSNIDNTLHWRRRTSQHLCSKMTEN